jgi:hypothetical protein
VRRPAAGAEGPGAEAGAGPAEPGAEAGAEAGPPGSGAAETGEDAPPCAVPVSPLVDESAGDRACLACVERKAA